MRDQRQRHGSDQDSDIKEKVIQIRRVTKVVKGGKKMSFRALVIVGDGKGSVGLGLGKANEVASAIRKAVEDGKKSLVKVALIDGSIQHEVRGKFSASNTILRPAPSGTGVIAGGSVRTVLELAGVKNIVAKSIGSANAINVARATLDALTSLKSLEEEEAFRGISLGIRQRGKEI